MTRDAERGRRAAREPGADITNGHRRDDVRSGEVVVCVLADPDLPATLAAQLHDVLPELLGEAVADTVTWTVRTVPDPFEEMSPDHSRLMAKAREHVRNTEWDLVVCVTDQPMRDESGVVVASIDTDGRVAVVSLPALGGLFLRRRLRAIVVPIIASLVAQIDGPRDPTVSSDELRRRLPLRRARLHEPESGPAQLQIVRVGWSSTPHLLAGMVRANRPWRLVLGLSKAMAGALAGIAFGVLYPSIWTLGTSLSPLRLAGLTMGAVIAMTVWVTAGHGLWERRHQTADGSSIPVHLRNASTLVTVAVGTVAFFLAMLTISLAAVALAIPPTYLADTIGGPVGVADYLTMALMATVLGTFAGAVGSGLEDDTAIREATYGYRERQRRERAERQADDHTSQRTG